MYKYLSLAFLSCCFQSVICYSQILITNTTVVDVEKQKLISGQNVFVNDGKIISITSRTPSQEGVTIIDGTGKYLIPGLVDAHVHFGQSGSIYTRPDAVDLTKYKSYKDEITWTHNHMENLLRKYLRVGITTVIDVGSTINFLKQRDSFRTKTYAPAVYMTGPLLTTWQPPVYKGLKDDGFFYEMKTVEDARSYVQQQLPFKPDFIKIWYIVNGKNTDSVARVHLPLVKAVIQEAHNNNLRVAVHATERITAQLAVEAGADFLVHGIDDELITEEFVQLLKSKKVVVSPTLIVANGYQKAFSQTYQLTASDFNYAHPTPVKSLIDFQHLPDTALLKMYKAGMQRNAAAFNTTDSLLKQNLIKLYKAGVTIATGTDAGNIGTQHAASYFGELQALQNTGMNMWQLLRASTINGAMTIGKEKMFGSVSVGKNADMLLLNRNPLEKLDNWSDIAYIINKGVAFRPDSIVMPSPFELAEQQLLAYNAGNLELFLSVYDDSIQIYTMPEHKLDMQGKDAMRKNYEFLKHAKDLHCVLLNRIVHDDTVIDHEQVTFQKGRKPVNAIAVYHIKNGKIRQVLFY